MAKRTRQPPSESSLSSAPDDLAVDVKTEETKVSKTEIEASTTVKTIKSTKRSHPSNGVDEAPASKRATKKFKVEETVEEDMEVKQNGTTKAKAKKTTTRKKEVDLAPLEDRTTDTKLRVGAHVSAAGGKILIPLTVSP
jgi:AP endonuclease 1